MRKLLYAIPAATIVATALFAPQPAFALPTCEQEISIRCHGYNVQGRPRLDIYYNSYEECVAAETPAQCGTQPDPYAAVYRRPIDAVLRQDVPMPA